MKDSQIAELAGINKDDFTVESTGKVHLATRKVAMLLGVPESTLRRWIKENGALFNVNENNQLDPESIVKIAKMAHLKYKQADIFLDKILVGGCNQLLQNLVGYEAKPLSRGEQLVANAQYLLSIEKELDLKAEKTVVDLIDLKVGALEQAVRGNQCPHGFLPRARLAGLYGLSLGHDLDELLDLCRSVKYPYASGNGGLKEATAYKVEDLKTLLEG